MTVLNPRPLSELVSVRPRYARSVHLSRDLANGLGADYHLTPSTLETLRVLQSTWERPADRAITLVGPYGSGKSAFALFLAALFRGDATSHDLLRALDQQLAEFFADQQHRLFPVALVGSRQSLAPALGRGLIQALNSDFPVLASEIENELEAAQFAPRAMADAWVRASRHIVEAGWGGLILLGDELGKWLEWAALHPGEGDIFALQELAEAAARSGTLQSGGAPLWVLAILHQNAEAYAQRLGRVHQAEWAKVGERFHEVPFFPSDAERLEMTGWALEHAPDLQLNGNFEVLSLRGPLLVPQSLPGSLAARFTPLAKAAYPLHPLVLLLLPPLFRKSGQSHRSLWNFLSGQESHALGRFLREATFGPNAPLFGADTLFDYASEVLLGGWSAGHLARAWAEAGEAIERAHTLSPMALRVLKVIALLGLLRDAHLVASPEILEWAVSDTSNAQPAIQETLDELLERHLIAWSRSRGTYRLWEGGDVDVEAALDTARAAQSGDMALQSALELCPPPRLLARRHSFLTGTLRSVEARPCPPPELPFLLENTTSLTVFFCLAPDEVAVQSAVNTAMREAKPNVLVVIARQSELLREAARDVAGAGEVEKNTPALQSDRAARRELSARLYEAQNDFIAEWERLFGADSSDARWFYRGKEKKFASSREWSAFLSDLADQTYPETPVLRNELLNRHELSSAAAAGRRALIEAMLLHPTEERLGMVGFPPEVSMYECLLREPGLHREVKPGFWEFGPPINERAKLQGVWHALEKNIFVDPPAPRPITELWETLRGAPYGLSEGVMPPLLLAFLLAYPNETTIYRDGSWLAEPGVADWEILLRRPEHFAVAGSRIAGERKTFIERLARAFGVEPLVVPVAAALVRNARRLSDHARQTSRLPETTKAIRRALESGSSPEKLLFSDLPQALGVSGLFSEEGDKSEGFFAALSEALKDWSAATPQLIERARNTLLEACGLTADETGWATLRREAVALDGGILEMKLVPFINRMAASGDDVTVLESVLALVANRPPRSWSDGDEDRFVLQARVYGALFQEALSPKAKSQTPKKSVPSDWIPKTISQPLMIADKDKSRELTERLKATLNSHTDLSRPDQIAVLRALLKEMEALEAE